MSPCNPGIYAAPPPNQSAASRCDARPLCGRPPPKSFPTPADPNPWSRSAALVAARVAQQTLISPFSATDNHPKRCPCSATSPGGRPPYSDSPTPRLPPRPTTSPGNGVRLRSLGESHSKTRSRHSSPRTTIRGAISDAASAGIPNLGRRPPNPAKDGPLGRRAAKRRPPDDHSAARHPPRAPLGRIE